MEYLFDRELPMARRRKYEIQRIILAAFVITIGWLATARADVPDVTVTAPTPPTDQELAGHSLYVYVSYRTLEQSSDRPICACLLGSRLSVIAHLQATNRKGYPAFFAHSQAACCRDVWYALGSLGTQGHVGCGPLVSPSTIAFACRMP